MKVKAVTFGFIKNLGNFQSQKLELTFEAENDLDTVDRMIEVAVAFVMEAHDFELTTRQQQVLERHREAEQLRRSF